MKEYNFKTIEEKWQKKWEELGLYQAKDFDKRSKQYISIEFPYLSGDGIHVGHVRSYSALDALVRKKRMQGYNVLYPIGWDAFGLPTENYAIKTGIHPIEITKNNIKLFKRQLKSLGLSFDWSREINTSDPKYYKWTQWIFLKLFEKGLAYQAKIPINWCPSCKIGLANEEVVKGKCERCGVEVERREQKQWMLKITDYADRLLEDLEKVDYSERIKTQQINWIGRSEGVVVKFEIRNLKLEISVFTTRLDTLFGVTALVIAPEHELIGKLKPEIKNWDEVQKYIKAAKKKSELERTDLGKKKTGVPLEGVYAINPANGEKIPIWVGDYVIATYGGGAVMIVPAHDKRDFQFAKKYGLEIREVVAPSHQDSGSGGKGGNIFKEAFVDYGVLVNSGQFNGLKSEQAIKKMADWLGKKKLGKKTVNYKLRDWIFSRQHYWGEPIPIIHCEKCGVVTVPEKDLPIELPYVKKYKPTETGESPLAVIKEWVNVACPECGGAARRETDTMPNWAGSNWYFLRYIDPGNDKELADFKKLKYWMPIDLYNGGMEHTTLHLLYSRFWYKFLYDIKVVPTPEPYAKRQSHGMVLAEDGRKMSKSFGNVINPDEVVEGYGADSLRLYEMFMGPFSQAINWSTEGLEGCYRFLKKVWVLFGDKKKINPSIGSGQTSKELIRKLHYTIKKVGDDLENMRFNTTVSAMMEFNNLWQEKGLVLSQKDAESFLKILAPFCPHICEEIWSHLRNKDSIFKEQWPNYDEKLIRKEIFELVIQINGKVRDKVKADADISEKQAGKLALEREKIKEWLGNKKTKKIVFIKGRLINIVV